MSGTTTIRMGERFFWAVDDACGVWLAYLVEEIARQGAESDPWLAESARSWRVAAAVTDYGANLGAPTPEQADRLRAIAVTARETARANGDVPVDRLRQWIMVGDLAVSDGFSRTGDRVGVDRVLEVADGSIALLDGSLRPDPPGSQWFLGTGDGWRVMGAGRRPTGAAPDAD